MRRMSSQKTFKISYRDPSKARFTIGSFHNICLNFNLLKPFVLNDKTAIANSWYLSEIARFFTDTTASF